MPRASTRSDPFNAIAEPRRRHILELLAGEERSVSEIAAALVQKGVETELVFPSEVLGDGTFPTALAKRYEQLFRDGGVEVVPGARVDEVRAVVVGGGEFAPHSVLVGAAGRKVTGEGPVDGGLLLLGDFGHDTLLS